MLQFETSGFGHEWTTLQNNYEQYERSSLLIKLGGIALFVACVALQLNAATTGLLMLVIWVQEAIFRTYQARLGKRILCLERLLKQASHEASLSYQLHSEWQASRPGVGGLLAEYGKSMLRPTVAFPHVVLMLMVMAWSVPG
jgi:hypothetical protein